MKSQPLETPLNVLKRKQINAIINSKEPGFTVTYDGPKLVIHGSMSVVKAFIKHILDTVKE